MTDHTELRPVYEGTTVRSLYVTMQDGVKIAIDVILPNSLPAGTRIPAILIQTCYWRAMDFEVPFTPPAESPQPSIFFPHHGYAVIIADVRGTGASFGVHTRAYMRE